MNAADPIVRLQGVSRRFGPIVALDDVDFACYAGEIHAVLGENGAGKSTLMKLIAGVLEPSDGHVEVDGKHTRLRSPAAAQAMGIVCMFQELSLAPDLSVQDNILLGAPSTGMGFVRRSVLGPSRELLNRIGGEHIEFRTRISDLTLPDRQLVEFAKALHRQPRLLILDEATSALNATVVERLFAVVRERRDQGLGVLFISHRFPEIESLADKVSVFRNGQHIETFGNGDYHYSEIIRKMIGQPLNELFPKRISTQNTNSARPVVLDVQNVSWQNVIRDVSMRVRQGEIIGIGGLDGQGQLTFLQALFGILKGVTGQVKVNGTERHINSPGRAKAADTRLAFVPEDRKTEGLIPALSILENMQLAAMESTNEKTYQALADELELVCASFAQPVGNLSGGNQQKVALIKWLALSPTCLLLADPTRGIDVKTKTQIYALLRRLADTGVAIVLMTTDHEELVHLCDAVHIFYGGSPIAVLLGDTLTSENVIAASLNVAQLTASPQASATGS